MTKFRRKPGQVIDAVQYWKLKAEEEPLRSHPGIAQDPNTGRDYVVTIHGERAHLTDGDFILPEPDGEHYYPCKPDIFEKTYELA